MRKVFIGGNWKCNGSIAFMNNYIRKVINNLTFSPEQCQVIISPTLLHLPRVKRILSSESNVELSAQNCSLYKNGAFTGEVSAKMLRDMGLHWVILGHSERRSLFGESNDVVGKKVNNALTEGLNVIACIGEKLQDRENGKTMNVILGQLEAIARNVKSDEWQKMVIAYEPVWAIGTGKTASPEQAQEVHGEVRNWMESKVGSDVSKKIRIIYGGSVTDKNADVLINKVDIDGFLVGGASLKPAFTNIVNAYSKKFNL